MVKSEILIQNTVSLIKRFRVLGSQIFVTEQYPKGFGTTENRIKDTLGNITPFQNMGFSCAGAGDLFAIMHYRKVKYVVITGIETHVCIQQTALDLLASGFQVSLAVDACSSRKEIDHNVALNRMRAEGVIITTTEAILFEMLNVCTTDEFKKIVKL
jgi:hypothetical protein